MGHDAYTSAGRSGGFNQDFSGFDFSGFQSGSGFDFDSIFEMFTGGGFGHRRRDHRGEDLRYDIELSLEEAATGTTRRITLRKHVACKSCDGAGGHGITTCTTCNGHGMTRQTRRTPFGMFQTTTPCGACQGTGERFEQECGACQGTGIGVERVELDVDIPAGVDTGTRVRVRGEGDAGPRNGPSGDLYLFIRLRPHPVFKREGPDIFLDTPVSFPTLVFGGEIIVPTLNGEAKLKIPRGTQTHTLFRLKGKGIADTHHHGKGDQYVRVIAETPERLTAKQEKALREYAGMMDNEPHKGLFEKLKERLT